MFLYIVPVYPLPDTAIVYIYFQTADRLTWIAHDVLVASSTATGQETEPALGRVPEIPSVELAFPRILNKPNQGMQSHPEPMQ